ncbi:IPTL-CTERM protein sorting domain [Delftia tsuruhatensis]|uniref:IPTL-CTERM sorting domain-containing protein n=1 Tax=Delftia tsuruhatensis TaxID=180282 RepID=UPI001E6FF080|nr:IPTL-CTERM sorting domain-containing protein [Delftia tsuruhatensis]CAB5698596.1 IPTL-CTERM protein sorting domain [Delftia tsuruhatensis]CAC9676450.1 IPTL-CTERM protein sorting domain [Delftia tsuruhatensis]
MDRNIFRAPWRARRKGLMGRTTRLALGGVLLASSLAQAAFVNGDFETGDLSGWTQEGKNNNGTTPSTPTSLADLRLVSSSSKPPLATVISGAEASLPDPLRASGSSDLLLPLRGSNTARINLSDTHISSYGNPPFTGQQSTASTLSQEVTLTANDIDADGKIHIRFTIVPVLNDAPGHTPAERPYYAIALTKTYDALTSSTVSTEVFFRYHYAQQPGVNWKSFTDASGEIHRFTNPQAYDVAPGNHIFRVGDKVRLDAIAAGCSPGAHSGHLYLDNVVTTGSSSGVWISATGPASAPRADSTEITYTYTYKNNGNAPVSNVVVALAMPKDSTNASTSFVRLVDANGHCSGPAAGVGSTDPAQCTVPSLAPGQTLKFEMTVKVPQGTPGALINNGDYTIRGDGLAPLVGALVQTQLLGSAASSDMAVDASGLPTSGTAGTPYPPTASFSCTNLGAAPAANAFCEAAGLPTGITVGQCTMNGTPWSSPATVPANATVICPVSGTPAIPGSSDHVTITTGADNDTDPTNNQETVSVSTTPPILPPPVPSVAAAPIPTLSEWGLIALSGLLGLMGWGMAHRRRRSGL